MKYIVEDKHDYNEHWSYCIKNDIPFIRIIPAKKYSKIEFDIFCMLNFHELKKTPSEFLINLYKCYAEFFRLPLNKFEYAGGSNNLIFTILKEHSEYFASQLFDYLNDFVKTNRI